MTGRHPGDATRDVGASSIIRHRPPWTLLALTVGGLLASCTTSSTPPGASSTTSTTSATSTNTTTPTTSVPCGVVASPDVVLTSHPEPCAVTTNVGVTVHVVLDTGFNWSDPTSDSAVVQVENVQRPSTGGGLQADLKAASVGKATLTSTGAVACPPGQPCPALVRLWELHVTVMGDG